MTRQLLFILALGFTSVSAQAADQDANYGRTASGEETTGFFSGIVVGGLAGGPPGALVGGVFGALLGDGWHAKKRVGDLQVNLYEMQLQLAQQREIVEAAQRELQLAQNALQARDTGAARVQPVRFGFESAAPCCDNTVLSLHFRSGSSRIEPQFEEQLNSMARLAQRMPTAAVEITGYADRNGDAEHNLALSRARSEAVKQVLERLGLPDASITTVAYGEAKPLHAEQNLETDFFDRRVILRLLDASKQMLTQTPEGR